MRKITIILTLCILIACLAAIVFTIRSLINFNQGDPLYEYMSQDQLVALIYDLVYFYSLVQIIFLGIILVMLLVLIMIAKNLFNKSSPKKTKSKETKQQKKQQKIKSKKRKKKEDEESSFMKEWRRMEREANKAP